MIGNVSFFTLKNVFFELTVFYSLLGKNIIFSRQEFEDILCQEILRHSFINAL